MLIDLTTLQSSGAWPRGLQVEVMAWINANLDELVKDWKKMASMKRPRLQAVQALDGHLLRVTFRNGAEYTLRFAEFFDESPGLAPLRDAAVFKQATLADDGWTIEWVAQDIQIGADTLWLDAQAQNTTDDNARIFAQWRARNGLTLAAAARALEMTPRTMSAYGTGTRRVPRYVALACKGWELEHRRQV